MSEKNPIEVRQDNPIISIEKGSNLIETREVSPFNSVDKKIQKVADFVTKAVLKDPEPIVFHGKDGAPDTVVENRGGLWRL
jgi:hypothetical protein